MKRSAGLDTVQRNRPGDLKASRKYSTLRTPESLAVALGHQRRLRILVALLDGPPGSATSLRRDRLSDLTIKDVDYHLKTLRSTGAVHFLYSQRVRGATKNTYELAKSWKRLVSEMRASSRADTVVAQSVQLEERWRPNDSDLVPTTSVFRPVESAKASAHSRGLVHCDPDQAPRRSAADATRNTLDDVADHAVRVCQREDGGGRAART